MIPPPAWTSEQLEAARLRSAEYFREGRHTEPLESYLDIFDQYQGVVEEVLEETVDLTRVEQAAEALFTDKRKQEVLRYVSGPPVSEDDLKTLVQSNSLAPARIRSDPALLRALVGFLRDWHDRRRFPWVSADAEATEGERTTAVIATTALIAMRKLETMRRSEGKALQELQVETRLVRAGLEKLETRHVRTLSEAPAAGQFCRESKLGNRKADFIIGLWDGRTLAAECKVSNSATNSVKRLNNDAAVKAEVWRADFGNRQVVPTAILSGVYKLHNLEDAQSRGLALFWAHDLQHFVDWLHRTRE